MAFANLECYPLDPSAEDLRDLRNVRPKRGDKDNPILRRQQHFGSQQQAGHTRTDRSDAFYATAPVVQLRQISGYALSQIGATEILRVERFALRQGSCRLIADELGGRLVGFPEPERQNIAAARAAVCNFSDQRTDE